MRMWHEVSTAFGFGESMPFWYTGLNERVLPAGQLLVFASAYKDDERSRQRFFDMLEGKGHSLGITVCYCSVLDDCWVVRWGEQPASEGKLPRDQCPISEADRFRN